MIRSYVIAVTLSMGAAGFLGGMLVRAVQQSEPRSTTMLSGTGQSRTQLSDGRWLIAGGQSPQGPPLATLSVFDPQTQQTVELPRRLTDARAWHSATTLADGTILLVGGRGSDGTTLSSVERFDPVTETFLPVNIPDLLPRAGHTATLLTDGRVLVAGGADTSGQPSRQIEIWDVDNGVRAVVQGLERRVLHDATLLGDGRVLLRGGASVQGRESAPELFDPQTGTVRSLTSPLADDGGILSLTDVRPSVGATGVSLDAVVSARFSHAVTINSVTSDHVTLAGPSGAVLTQLVVAEHGRLMFVRPVYPLDANATYTVTFNQLVDDAGAALAPTAWTFRTVAAVPDPDPATANVWTPGQYGPGWRMNAGPSRWQQLKPLQAPPGVTALAGQLLRLNGEPLAGVTLEVEGRTGRSDGTGRFLIRLDDRGTEHVELWVDGRTAHGLGETFGTYEIGVTLRGGETLALPYTIWMPALDTANAVTIPSPTTGEVIISTPTIPGLELRLPPRTVIRDHEGTVVTTISITPVPLDRPPFPLPAGVDVPLYFTVQPGGAYIHVYGTTGRRGGRLIYPNGLGLAPGTAMDFWRYKPDGAGWHVYGRGRVTPTGQQVVPDPGVEFYEFTGAMVGGPGLAPPIGPVPGNSRGQDGDPVDLATGLFVMRKTDVALPDVLPITLTRTYRQADTRSRAFGIGTNHPYDVFVVGDTFPYTYQDLVFEDGARVHFDRISPGTSWTDAVYEHVGSPTIWYKATIAWNGNGWTLTRKDGTIWKFREGFEVPRSMQTALVEVKDKFGNTLSLTRDGDANLTTIVSPNGRSLTLSYDTSYRITQVQDNIGRTVTYQYDTSGRLWKVTDPENGVTEYTYDAAHRMLTVKDPRGIVYLTNEYGAGDRVIRQTLVGGGTYEFAYTVDAQGFVTQTDVTNPRGFVRRVGFNSNGYTTGSTEAFGHALARTTTWTRQAGSNFVTSSTDGLNRRTDFTYDGMGNVLTLTRLAGTADAVTTTYTYEPVFQQLASATDPLNHTWTLGYDGSAKLTSVTDPLTHVWSVSLNASGQLVSVSDPLQHQWQAQYTDGDLTSLTNPLGHTWTAFVDAAGRLISVTDPLGQRTRATYDRLNRVTTVTDALGGETSLIYDGNSNVLSLMDALSHATSYTYDSSDRVDTHTDALLKITDYVYDLKATSPKSSIARDKRRTTSTMPWIAPSSWRTRTRRPSRTRTMPVIGWRRSSTRSTGRFPVSITVWIASWKRQPHSALSAIRMMPLGGDRP